MTKRQKGGHSMIHTDHNESADDFIARLKRESVSNVRSSRAAGVAHNNDENLGPQASRLPAGKAPRFSPVVPAGQEKTGIITKATIGIFAAILAMGALAFFGINHFRSTPPDPAYTIGYAGNPSYYQPGLPPASSQDGTDVQEGIEGSLENNYVVYDNASPSQEPPPELTLEWVEHFTQFINAHIQHNNVDDEQAIADFTAIMLAEIQASGFMYLYTADLAQIYESIVRAVYAYFGITNDDYYPETDENDENDAYSYDQDEDEDEDETPDDESQTTVLITFQDIDRNIADFNERVSRGQINLTNPQLFELERLSSNQMTAIMNNIYERARNESPRDLFPFVRDRFLAELNRLVEQNHENFNLMYHSFISGGNVPMMTFTWDGRHFLVPDIQENGSFLMSILHNHFDAVQNIAGSEYTHSVLAGTVSMFIFAYHDSQDIHYAMDRLTSEIERIQDARGIAR